MRTMTFIAVAMVSFSTFSNDIATIGPSSFASSTGAIAVNLAAGDFNIQSSNFVHSPSGDYELTVGSSPALSYDNETASASIAGDAFSNASGYISAQMAAGNSNQQHNVVIFSPESEVNWETVDLSSLRAAQVESVDSPKKLNVELSPKALAGASGVIQMSQIAGTGNTARNTFQMPTTIN